LPLPYRTLIDNEWVIEKRCWVNSTLRALKHAIFGSALLSLGISASQTLAESPPSPGEPDAEFSRELKGRFSGSDFADLTMLLNRTSIQIFGSEKEMLCKVLATQCDDRQIFESIRFTHIFFFLKVSDGKLSELTIESPRGILHRFDLDGNSLVKFEFGDSFSLAGSCQLVGSLAVLDMTDERLHGGILFAYDREVGCPEHEGLREAHKTIPWKFHYVSLDGATGYSEKD